MVGISFLLDCSLASLHILSHLIFFFANLFSSNFTTHLLKQRGMIVSTPSSVVFCKIKSCFCSFIKEEARIISFLFCSLEIISSIIFI